MSTLLRAALASQRSGVPMIWPPAEAAPAAGSLSPGALARYRAKGHISEIIVGGATLAVAWDEEGADSDECGVIPPKCWVEAVQIGGAWMWAEDVFADQFRHQMDAALEALQDGRDE